MLHFFLGGGHPQMKQEGYFLPSLAIIVSMLFWPVSVCFLHVCDVCVSRDMESTEKCFRPGEYLQL